MTDTPLLAPQAIRDAVTGLSDDVKFPDATLARFVARFEGLFIAYRGAAPCTRTRTQEIDGCRTGHLTADRPHLTAVTAVAYDPTGTTPDPATVKIRGPLKRHLWLPDGQSWPGQTWITVTYQWGYTEAPAAAIDACIEFVRAEALQQKGSQPRNVTGERTDLGWIPEPTADPGKGRPTRWTIVNEALNSIPDERLPGVA